MSESLADKIHKPVRRVALETLGFEIEVDPDMPSDEIVFRDERGKELGRIIGLKPTQGDDR
ncbi:MAG TPA: hypothetical protein VFS41_04570 [Edaphobacter sp.]|nr:hypothetical protein [Edaphobacter sp.]